MIDFHTQPIMIKELVEADPALGNQIHDVLGFHFTPQPLSVFLFEMDACGVEKSVLLPIDCSTTHKCTIPSNDTIAALCDKNSRFMGFASVDPNSKSAAKDLEKAFKELGLKGLYLDPGLQRFNLDDHGITDPLYHICTEYKRPLLMQCGINWSPRSLLRLGNPLLLEETIQKFPQLKIIISNFGWPWFRETLTLAMKYRNTYLDTSLMFSGTPKQLLAHFFSAAIDKGMFERNLFFQTIYGSNFPRVDMRRTMRGMQSVGFSEEFKLRLFQENAISILE